ncbi:DUF1996 domain-containing protein [Streptomyces apocyni]|uniref:DUF1996 domain-containing protein n=1 Tax=Streptomyces apocyni TaxID=2654677 RepID=UPI0012EAF724|nr:DUF1996 domain-containing protein [Streptomyces apocyni]
MGNATRKRRSTPARRAIAAAAALILGAGGLVAANVYASAGEGWSGRGGDERNDTKQQTVQRLSTIDCPDVGNELREVPDSARAEVDRELANLDTQITDAYQRFAETKRQLEQDPNAAQNIILGPLASKRTAAIDRIAISIGRSAERPEGLKALARCTLRADDNQNNGDNNDNGNNGNNGNGNGNNEGDNDQGQGQGGNGGQAGNGPAADDFVEIQSVQPNVSEPRQRRGASRGTFSTDCGVNANGKFNSDNIIVAPGVSNGAHHMHDYVGNQANDAFASDRDLARGATTCRNQGDRSTYYWPVLRIQNGADERDANEDGGGNDQNVGQIQRPAEVELKFVGNPKSRVTAMPRFLRIITGDAKAFTNGDANANASWSCTGFEDRQLKDKYPLCPEGSDVVRTFNFQSCWDGKNTDSANHRTHVAFAQEDGSCPRGFRAIPQLQQRIVYDIPAERNFAVDSFPEQLHKPITDHGDFINVFNKRLMNRMVSCINDGRNCR